MSARTVVVSLLRTLRLNRVIAHLYYQYIHGFASAGSELPEVVERCLKHADERGAVDGADYCEFGLFKGYTFLQAQLAAKRLGLDKMRFFGFDSFEGLPPVGGVDDTEKGEFYEGQYRCPLGQVRKSLDQNGVDWRRTELTKGFFSDSLTPDTRQHLGLEKVAVALVDCDLYSSTVDVLSFLEPLLQDGCVLIMDDWNAFDADDNKGERLALREFLERNTQWKVKLLFAYGDYGQAFELQEVANQ